jgi:hypothetical protein
LSKERQAVALWQTRRGDWAHTTRASEVLARTAQSEQDAADRSDYIARRQEELLKEEQAAARERAASRAAHEMALRSMRGFNEG